MTLDEIVHAISDIFDKNESVSKIRADVIRYFRDTIPNAKAATERDEDDCEFCLGAKGGAKGNGNIIGGVVICDYCTALYRKMREADKG